jgi:putative heme-binding domain-containing protein
VRVSSNVPFESTLGGEEPQAGAPGVFRLESTGEPTMLTVALVTRADGGAPALRVTYESEDDAKPRTVSRDQLLLPWVPAAPPVLGPVSNVPNLDGGDPARGAVVFKSVDAKCATCHKVRGEGENVGPDLTNLNGRDRLSVYRDIAEPSARIHPDYVPYTVAMKDGRILVGTVRAVGAAAIRVIDTEAKATLVPRAEVEDLRPSATSIMPVGLAGAIGEERLRDLIAYLTAPPTANSVDAAKK